MQPKDLPKSKKPAIFKPTDILKVNRFGGNKFNQSKARFNSSQFRTQHKGGS